MTSSVEFSGKTNLDQIPHPVASAIARQFYSWAAVEQPKLGFSSAKVPGEEGEEAEGRQ